MLFLLLLFLPDFEVGGGTIDTGAMEVGELEVGALEIGYALGDRLGDVLGPTDGLEVGELEDELGLRLGDLEGAPVPFFNKK